MKFKIKQCAIYNGDLIQYKGTDVEILEAYPATFVTCDHYLVGTFDGSSIFADEDELKSYDDYYRLPSIPKECECGARYQRGFENWHSTWCALYKEIK